MAPQKTTWSNRVESALRFELMGAWLRPGFIKKPVVAYQAARNAVFLGEYLLMNGIMRWVPGAKMPRREISRDQIRDLQARVIELLEQDAENIREGFYPISVLMPENPVAHMKRLAHILTDAVGLYRRRQVGRTTVFSGAVREKLAELPCYYRRNFHFQTEGYLSRNSAELYEHQVELLFAGTADAMRRMVLPPLVKWVREQKKLESLRLLEVGAGTGRATSFVAQALPHARITAMDLSDAYLAHARKVLEGQDRIDFVQGAAESTPYRDGVFDAVYSVFLFHELPEETRKSVLAEAFRVLKPGGFFALVDSAQEHDLPKLASILRDFPANFHEPFYRNYLGVPMEQLVEEAGFERVNVSLGLVSKCLVAQKP